MGFKIKNIPELINGQRFTANDIVYSVKEVVFRYEEQSLAIEWRLTPSGWQAGEARVTQTQVIPFAQFLSPEYLAMVVETSDVIHQICMTFPFIPTIDGLKSFAQLNADTIDVGLG